MLDPRRKTALENNYNKNGIPGNNILIMYQDSICWFSFINKSLGLLLYHQIAYLDVQFLAVSSFAEQFLVE